MIALIVGVSLILFQIGYIIYSIFHALRVNDLSLNNILLSISDFVESLFEFLGVFIMALIKVLSFLGLIWAILGGAG